MERAFLYFLEELKKPSVLRKGFTRKRKHHFSISDKRINELYDRYFSDLSIKNKSFSFKLNPKDFDEVNYLLRVHFRLWIAIEEQSVTIYREFPERFRVTQEVNPENHWFTPKSFAIGSILYYGEDHYSVCNRLKGIPLSEILTSKDRKEIRPVVQINYDFIAVLEN